MSLVAVAAGLACARAAEARAASVVKLGPESSAVPGAAARHAKVQILSDLSSIAPGGTAVLGIAFDIQPKWHIYWNGRNDSGTAPEVEWKLPEGWTVSPLRWPAPERHVAPGDIVDHVYEGQAVLLATLTAPKDAKPGSAAAISAKVSYLVCNEACVPESADVSVNVNVRADAEKEHGAASGPRNTRIVNAEKRLPVPISQAAERVKLSWEAATATIRVPGATRVEFFPSEACADIKNLVTDGAKDGDVLQLTIEGDPDKRLDGVIAVRRAKAPSEWYVIEAARWAASGAASDARKDQKGTGTCH